MYSSPWRYHRHFDSVRVYRTVLRLMLLLVALAIAGATDEWRTSPVLDTVPGAGSTAAASVLETDNGPEQSSHFNIVRPPGLSIAGRVLERGPPVGGLRPAFHPFAGRLPLLPSLEPTRLRALARTRLDFAHEIATAQSGALSSFSTTLPPPLLA